MFYLTLPSNSSLQYYPNNTLTNYTTHFSHPFDLQGKWEVGLAEIQYPHTWHNVGEGDAWIEVKKRGRAQRYNLPSGQYNTPEDLIAQLGHMLRSRKVDVVIAYHDFTQKVTLGVGRHCEITMSDTLRIMLGLKEENWTIGTYNGIHVVDVNQGFYSLYVYCSVIEPRNVGDSKVPLLRIVPVEGKSGQMITKTYEHIQYIPILQKHFANLEIDIKKDTGERVPFELGKLVVTLHFRKQRPYL